MRLRLVSAGIALLGALILLVVGVLALASSGADWHQGVAIVGYVLVLLALAIMGFCLVEKAPIWLGIIVAVCVPLLAASLWQAVAPPIEDSTDRGEGLVWLLAALVGLVLGLAQHRQHRLAEERRDRIGR